MRNIDFIGHKKIYFIISGALILLTLICSFVFGVEMDIQFKGGSMLTYSYVGDVDADAVATKIGDLLEETVGTQKAESGAMTNLIVSLTEEDNLSIESQQKVTDLMQSEFPDNNFVLEESSSVNPVMGKEFFAKCMVAVLAASLLIIIYIGFRFYRIGGISAGAMGVIALIHDAIMVYATFVVCRIPINDGFIAVVLTILGFSINDTIVIYDRIRENERLYGDKKELGEIVNLSINQSLTRSINTSLCAITAMVIVCIVALVNGVTSILNFAFPMIIGMVSGVYSTICIAGPLWVAWKNFSGKRKKNKKVVANKAGKINI